MNNMLDNEIQVIALDLGTNYHNDPKVLKKIHEHYLNIAANSSNRNIEDKKLLPYVYIATKEAYLRRGDEGTSSSSEGSLNYAYVDIEEKLRKDVKCIRRIK